MILLRAAAVLLSLSLSATSLAGIGSVEKNTGTADLFRSKEKIAVKQALGVQMNDDIRTGNGTVNIGFDDKTKVRVEKHSSLVIDDFVYDNSKPTASRLGLKVALGTVKYASGLIAKNNKQSVDIRTPTARIGVLGTSFSMTVDEIGKSLIILLPNPDGSVGKIVVESDVGQVIMNQAFQATVVGSSEGKPSKPVILDLTEAQINNLLIIKEPKEKKEDEEEQAESNLLDFVDLDTNFLEEDALAKDQLEFTRLDFSLLDINLLQNILAVLNARLLNEVDMMQTNPVREGVFDGGNTQIYKDGTKWVIFRSFDGRIAQVSADEDSQTQIQFNQAGDNVTFYTQEDASDSIIVINQN